MKAATEQVQTRFDFKSAKAAASEIEQMRGRLLVHVLKVDSVQVEIDEALEMAGIPDARLVVTAAKDAACDASQEVQDAKAALAKARKGAASDLKVLRKERKAARVAADALRAEIATQVERLTKGLAEAGR